MYNEGLEDKNDMSTYSNQDGMFDGKKGGNKSSQQGGLSGSQKERGSGGISKSQTIPANQGYPLRTP